MDPEHDALTPEAAEAQSWVRMVIGWTYAVAAVVFVAVWLFLVGSLIGFSRPGRFWLATVPGLCVGLGFLALNFVLGTTRETISSHAVESLHAAEVQRNAFYISAAMFSLSGIVMSLNRSMVRTVAPLLVASLFFAIILVLAPVWVSDENGQELIVLKHARTATFLTALGLLTSALGIILLLDTRPSDGFHWSLGYYDQSPELSRAKSEQAPARPDSYRTPHYAFPYRRS